MSPTPQTPPTDRPLTAGDVLWMVHVLGPDDIYPAPDHATAVDWCDGINGAIPDSDVLCVAVPALWTGSSKDHAAGLKDARDAFSALARPATSAASEGEGVSRAVDHLTARLNKPGAFRIDDEPHLRTILAALASPPASERERELEGAVEAFKKAADPVAIAINRAVNAGPSSAVRLTQSEAMAVIAATSRALTAQPAGEGK